MWIVIYILQHINRLTQFLLYKVCFAFLAFNCILVPIFKIKRRKMYFAFNLILLQHKNTIYNTMC